LADAVAAASQLLLHVILSPQAGRLRGAAWAALGVLLPPALAVHGLPLLRALLLAAAALRMAAARRWGLLALLLAGCAAAWLGRLQRPTRPPPAPW
jgi:hypothetical protein